MPKKLTDEQKAAAFENWRNTDEYAKIMKFSDQRGTITAIEMGTKDIIDNWVPFLTELFELISVLKIPGRKVKSKNFSITKHLGYE